LPPRSEGEARTSLHAVAAIVLEPPDARVLAVESAVHPHALARAVEAVAAKAVVHAMNPALAATQTPGLSPGETAAVHTLLDARPLPRLSSVHVGRSGLRRDRPQAQHRARGADQDQLVNALHLLSSGAAGRARSRKTAPPPAWPARSPPPLRHP